jgi:hypothetical protein
MRSKHFWWGLVLQRYLNAESAEAAEGGWSNNGKAISVSGSQSMLFAVPLSLQFSALSVPARRD